MAELERPLDDALARRFSREARPAIPAQNRFIHLFYNAQLDCRQTFKAAVHGCHSLISGAHQLCQGLSRLSDTDAQSLSTEA